MKLADYLMMLDTNPYISELKIFGDESGIICNSLSTGSFSLRVNQEYMNAFVNHWLIFGDDEYGYTVHIEIEE